MTLVDLLREKGFDLARRTVAKYREAIGLGSSVQRRRQKALGGRALTRPFGQHVLNRALSVGVVAREHRVIFSGLPSASPVRARSTSAAHSPADQPRSAGAGQAARGRWVSGPARLAALSRGKSRRRVFPMRGDRAVNMPADQADHIGAPAQAGGKALDPRLSGVGVHPRDADFDRRVVLHDQRLARRFGVQLRLEPRRPCFAECAAMAACFQRIERRECASPGFRSQIAGSRRRTLLRETHRRRSRDRRGCPARNRPEGQAGERLGEPDIAVARRPDRSGRRWPAACRGAAPSATSAATTRSSRWRLNSPGLSGSKPR